MSDERVVKPKSRPKLDPQIEALVTEFYHLRLQAGDHPRLARRLAIMLATSLYYPHRNANKAKER